MPEKLYITRKRKLWKFWHFDQWQNCWQSDQVTPKVVRAFVQKKKLTVEIGAGKADLSVELAKQFPAECFIACDIKSDRLYTGAKYALENKIDNIRFLRTHINEIASVLPKHAVDNLWITFPDPFSRKRSAKHRLTHPHFLKLYKQVLKPGGTLHFKTDNQKLFEWSLEQFEATKWIVSDISRDLHSSGLHGNYKITTTFERKFMSENRPIHYLQATIV